MNFKTLKIFCNGVWHRHRSHYSFNLNLAVANKRTWIDMDRSALSSVVFQPSSWQETPGSSAARGSSRSSRSLYLSRHSPGGSGTIWCLCHALS